nr:hypothetical protein [Tanacetum cinerariifolium]
NGNSFKPVPRTTANADGTSTLTIPDPVTTKEKAQKKNAVKARSMLLMALLNEHLLIFSQYKDSKTLFETIHARFGGNDATKKSQRTLLKQLYDNFNAPSTESLDSIFNRLQKIKNKADLDTMSIDDLYNNFKIVEEEVKRTVTSSSSSRSKNMAFLSSLGSTNEVDTASIQFAGSTFLLSCSAKLTATLNPFPLDHPHGFFLANSRKTVNGEDTSSKAMVAIDGAGFDWSYMTVDEVPTNMALMDFSDSENRVHKSEFDLATYKRGLFAPPTIDFSNSVLEEFQHLEFKGYGPKDSNSFCVDTSNEIKKAPDAPIIKDWVFDSNEDESKEMILKSDNVQHKPEQANQPRKVSQNPRNTIKNWNK